jgi:hypothetical protein
MLNYNDKDFSLDIRSFKIYFSIYRIWIKPSFYYFFLQLYDIGNGWWHFRF